MGSFRKFILATVLGRNRNRLFWVGSNRDCPDNCRTQMELQIHPLTPSRWADFEVLLGKNGGCAGCWCMWWRLPRAQWIAQNENQPSWGTGPTRQMDSVSHCRPRALTRRFRLEALECVAATPPSPVGTADGKLRTAFHATKASRPRCCDAATRPGNCIVPLRAQRVTTKAQSIQS